MQGAMRRGASFGMLFLLASTAAAAAPPPCAPVEAMVRAVAAGDVAAFQDAFTAEVREAQDGYGAGKVLRIWRDSLRQDLGMETLIADRLTCEAGFDGDEGKVRITALDGAAASVLVTRSEGGAWRINER